MASSTCGAFENSSPYALRPQAHSSHNILLELVPEDGNSRRPLDVGCADGYLSHLFAERGFAVTAIDAPGSRRRTIPDGIRYIEADLDCGLPTIDGTFDFVVCADILERLRDPDALLRQIRSQIADGGRLIGSLPNSDNIYFRLNVLLGRFCTRNSGLFDRTHLHYHAWDGWTRLLQRNGFRITTIRTTLAPFSLSWPRLPRWTAALESRYALAARAWSKLSAYQCIVVAENQSI
jgi:SAM-dependent methyltransferase